MVLGLEDEQLCLLDLAMTLGAFAHHSHDISSISKQLPVKNIPSQLHSLANDACREYCQVSQMHTKQMCAMPHTASSEWCFNFTYIQMDPSELSHH
jgi:hypothetical protein